MAVSAFFHSEPVADERGAERRTLCFETSGRTPAGADAAVLVHNASVTGMLLETAEPLAAGDAITVDLPHVGTVTAEVVWSSGPLHGCRFATPVSAGTLSATELASVAGLAPGTPPVRETTPASFGLRLQQLRKARGLTLAAVADALSVSKPTVWAWEHGKARPVDSRLPAIAETLGVEPGELEPETSAMVPGDLVDRCRAQIAEAVGIPAGNVRILIEL